MKEKWNEFVYDLCEAKNRNAEESEYQFIIESQLKLLGWLKSKGEICHKANIPIGNNNYIQPDILIKKNDIEVFVIEVKRPVHKMTDRERQQLVSYMRQLKLMVGVYIGERIEVFYDKPGSPEVESVLKVELTLDSPNGEQFVKLFDRMQFDEDSIVGFCEEQLKSMEQKKELLNIREQLLSNGNSIIAESLKEYLGILYDNSFSKENLEEMLSSLRFSVNPVSEHQDDDICNTQPTNIRDTRKTQMNEYGNDDSEYMLNGSLPMGKGDFVLAVVKEYIKLYPQKTYSELENVFKSQYQLEGNRIDSLRGSNGLGVIRTPDYIKQKGYVGKRYHDEVLYSADKVQFKVCNQWGIGNIGNIIELAKRLGFEVQVLFGRTTV